ncbi:MAG TPA: hypothetical protein VG815_19475 [Chloroflexota bacterium]|jgi:protein-tyrosine-phosphatase|nr:hypothetical protein [Chloroflexota bacterium]
MLADDVRWALVAALARSDYRVRELVQIVHRPYNLVSYHLRQLKARRIVVERRSSHDARDVYYSLDLRALRDMIAGGARSLHPALAGDGPESVDPDLFRRPRLRILFLCTHNSGRSQMAEGITRHLGRGAVKVFSAGSSPRAVHPDAVAALARLGIDISAQRSKSMDEFAGERFDYVVTVCDNVRESCPIFPDTVQRIHWSFADPSTITDPDARRVAFDQVAEDLVERVGQLLLLIREERSVPAS